MAQVYSGLIWKAIFGYFNSIDLLCLSLDIYFYIKIFNIELDAVLCSMLLFNMWVVCLSNCIDHTKIMIFDHSYLQIWKIYMGQPKRN